MSPLQSLMLLHAADADPSRRYVQRMQQAVKVLYGQASPSEALAAATLAVGRLDLDAFVSEEIGIGDIEAAFDKMHRGDVLRSVVVL